MLKRILTFGLIASAAVMMGCSTSPTGTFGLIAQIAITAPSTTVTVGSNTQLTAAAYNNSGERVPALSMAWSTSNASVATVGPTGLLKAIAPGNATISAGAGGRVGTVDMTVIAK
jgi:uncharacterized protein YjdB